MLVRYDPLCGLVSPNVEALKAGVSNASELVDLALKGRNLLIDCGGNTFEFWDTLFRIVRPNLLDTLAQIGAKITLVVMVSDDLDSQDYFVRYDSLFPGATKILATIGDDVRANPGFPTHPEKLTITLPRMPDILNQAVQRLAKPVGEIALMPPEGLKFPVGFARNADLAFSEQFTRILDYLKP
jgi:hypothetical protein